MSTLDTESWILSSFYVTFLNLMSVWNFSILLSVMSLLSQMLYSNWQSLLLFAIHQWLGNDRPARCIFAPSWLDTLIHVIDSTAQTPRATSPTLSFLRPNSWRKAAFKAIYYRLIAKTFFIRTLPTTHNFTTLTGWCLSKTHPWLWCADDVSMFWVVLGLF